MSAKVDTLAAVEGLGSSINDVRYLARATLAALGISGDYPTIETIYEHGCTEISADLRRLAESLESKPATEEIGLVVSRMHDRLELLKECAHILAGVLAAEKAQEEASPQ